MLIDRQNDFLLIMQENFIDYILNLFLSHYHDKMIKLL